MKKEKKKNPFRIGSLWAGPSVLMLLCLSLVPLIMLLGFSFMNGNIMNGVFPGWTLENFRKMFSGDTFSKLMGKSLGIGALVTLICIVISYPIAWGIAKVAKPHNRSMFLMLIILPFFTSQLLLIYAMMMILQSGGILMTLLNKIGIASNGTSILYTPRAVILVLVYEYLPYMILCLYTSLESIGDNLVHASRVLGANTFRTFVNIVFPMSIPGLLSGILLVLVPVCGSFAESALVGGPNGMMVGSLINSQYNTVLNMGYGAALSCVFLIILSIIMGVIRLLVNCAEKRIGGDTE